MKECLWCKKEFTPLEKEVKRGNGKFCSRSCSSQHRVSKTVLELNTDCAWCHKKFHKALSKKSNSRSGLFFCSRICKDTAQKIGGLEAIQPNHYGTVDTASDYRGKAFSFYSPCCYICGWDKVIPVLQVHHKDRDRKNNKIENLVILCPTCHQVEHYLSNDGLYTRANWNAEHHSS